MKIGILREEKSDLDRRVVLTPSQCRWIIDNLDIDLVVRDSNIRCFTDKEYLDLGITLTEDLSDCDILLGIKEVPKDQLIPNKIYLYFSHTIKKQEYNRELLQRMINLNIQMVDYEMLKDKKNKRLIGFGRYAGIVGSYNAFIAYGLKSNRYVLKPAHSCSGRSELESELFKIDLSEEKIILTGEGRVANGALEILNKANIREVSKLEFINEKFQEPVFCRLSVMDYNERIDGSVFDKYDFYDNPDKYQSSFMKYAKHADIFIAGHFYAYGSPYLYNREDVRSDDFNIKVVADISCDIDGPVATTIRPSTIEDPIYGYNPEIEIEDDFLEDGVIAVMAVDNLPCELPKDASDDFGEEIINKVLPLLVNSKENEIIERATICKNGDLSPNFEYLRDFVNGD